MSLRLLLKQYALIADEIVEAVSQPPRSTSSPETTPMGCGMSLRSMEHRVVTTLVELTNTTSGEAPEIN